MARGGRWAPAAWGDTFICHDSAPPPHRHARPRRGRRHRRRGVLGPRPPPRDARTALGPAPLHLPHHRRRRDPPARRGATRRRDARPPPPRDLGEPAHLGRLGRLPSADAARDHARPAGVRALGPHTARRLLRGADVATPARGARHPRRAARDRRRQLAGWSAGVGARGDRLVARGGPDPGRRRGLSLATDLRPDRIQARADAGGATHRVPAPPAERDREQPAQRLRRSVARDPRAGGPLLRDGGARREPRRAVGALPRVRIAE